MLLLHTIFTADAELLAYRFHLDRIWHVAVLCEQPNEAIQKRLEKILGAGERISLPSDVLKLLEVRREQAKQ